MFEYYNGTMAVHASWLYQEAGLITYDNYKKLVIRGWLNVLRRACRNTPALIEFDSMRPDIKEAVIEIAGDPRKSVTKNLLADLITPDHSAIRFYAEYRKPSGEPLAMDIQKKYATNAILFNAISTMIENKCAKSRAMGQSKTKMWQVISEAVNTLEGYTHTLPGNHRRLKAAYEKYKTGGYESIIHKGQGNDNSAKIVGEVGEWLLANYCLPNKPMVPAIMEKYNTIREEKQWPALTESAVLLWLDKPAQKRIWTLSRHGKDTWTAKFGYSMKRDRSNWFPNAYWAIDGSKLDWIHYEDTSLGMAAKLKINPLFDVYSEKIIGYSFSETESHIDHFNALKMAVSTTNARPYLLTYDNQSGHKSQRMQELYTALVSHDGGTHYPHKAYQKSNPVEQILGRLQKQVLNQLWFSDKQTIKARSLDNVPNMEFVKKNAHNLYTREQLIQWWEASVKKWNEAEHPKFKGQSRNEVYEHEAPMSAEMDLMEMLQVFWINETQAITYKREGLQMKLAGEIYQYEVYDQDNNIDTEFRRKYIGEKFIVRYDPDLMNQGVQLWLNTPTGKTFIATAQPKRAHESIPVLMKEGANEIRIRDFLTTENEYARDLAELQRIQSNTGITPEKLIEEQELMIKMGGDIPKDDRSEVEAASIFHRI